MSTPAAEDKDPNKKDPWDKENKHRFNNKPKSEYFDPCQEFAARSIRCLNRNGGAREFCTDYFDAYRACKKEWTTKRNAEKNRLF
ncbi:cytochrome c oxidase-assembly factor cox-23, mitochondrial [Xylariaceae sp. FL0594]|nr:cytochrome c oxidase-assembly factor cox-23, mitochondrial [Xylariaceae sp. FL0594]